MKKKKVRVIYFFIQPFLREEYLDMNFQINFLLNNFPSFIFLTCYSIILYILANIYHGAKISSPEKQFRVRKILFWFFLGIFFYNFL